MEEEQQQQQQQQEQWEPGRELFEALLLSSPAVGAAEAMALLGTCRAARSVGAAASLANISAVAVVNSENGEPVVPLIRDLDPSQENNDSPKVWLQRTSAVRGRVARDAAARVVLNKADSEVSTDPVPALSELLRRCPNVVSLRLVSSELPDVGLVVGRELGALAPSLEVGLIKYFLASLSSTPGRNPPSVHGCITSYDVACTTLT